jgi:hypothetical protein
VFSAFSGSAQDVLREGVRATRQFFMLEMTHLDADRDALTARNARRAKALRVMCEEEVRATDMLAKKLALLQSSTAPRG